MKIPKYINAMQNNFRAEICWHLTGIISRWDVWALSVWHLALTWKQLCEPTDLNLHLGPVTPWHYGTPLRQGILYKMSASLYIYPAYFLNVCNKIQPGIIVTETFFCLEITG